MGKVMKQLTIVSLVATIWSLVACTSAPKPKPIIMSITQPVQMRVMSVGAPTASSQIQVKPVIPDSFDNSTWQFMQIRGQRMSANTVAPIFSFKSGELSGFTGCKTLTGTYQRDGVDLWITSFQTDSQSCDAMQSQQQLVEWALMQVRHIRIIQANNYLALLDDHNNLLAELKPLNAGN